MTGPLVVGKLEVEFIPGSGTFVDLSSRCMSVEVIRPRPSQDGKATTTTLVAVLDNAPDGSGFCPLTPDSPATPYHPNITRDRRVRATAVVGSASYIRFFGWADTWTPDAPDGDATKSTVTLTASCVLSRYARRRTLSLFGEMVGFFDSRSLYYPFDESPDADLARVVSPTPVGAVAGEVIAPTLYPGSASFTAADGGHLTDGQIDFTRGGDNAPAPVILLNLRDPNAGNPQYIMGWYRLGNDPAGALGDDMLSAYNAAGQRLWVWSVKVVSGNITWSMYDNTGVSRAFLNTNAPRDEGWHYWAIWLNSSTGTSLFTRTKGVTGQQGVGSLAWPYDPRPVRYLVVGGQMLPANRGAQSNTFQGSISSLAVQYAASDLAQYGNPGIVEPANSYVGALDALSVPIDVLIGGRFNGTSDTTPIAYTNAPTDLLEHWNLLALTTGGAIITRPDGRRQYRPPADVRPAAVALTLDASADLHMPAGGWQAVSDERPTRVTVSAPSGSVTVIDTATETATGLRLEGPSLTTSAGTIAVARAAAIRTMATKAPRLARFGVDLMLTATDRTAALMALLPGDRLQVAGLPVALTGVASIDAFASGWTERYDVHTASFVFDTDPVGVETDIGGLHLVTDTVVAATVSLDWTWAGATVTGWKVGRDGVDSTGFGAFETILDPAARHVVFDKLLSGTSYNVYVAAMSGATELARASSTIITKASNLPGGAIPLVGFSGLSFNSVVFTGDTTGNGANNFGIFRGRPMDGLLTFTSRQSWDDLNFRQPDHAAWAQSGHLLITSMPHAPETIGPGMNVMGANDAFVTEQRALGASIASQGLNVPTHVIRVDWECNGDWYPWSIANGGAGALRLALINFVTNVRAGGATNVKFDLCFNNGPSQAGADFAAFPGAEYIDVIAVDSYDWFNAVFNDGDWATKINRSPGLQTCRDFAVANGIQFALDEGGNIHVPPGGGDNPIYWQKMWQFFNDPLNTPYIAWHNTYNHDGAPDTLHHTFVPHNPNSLAFYLTTWGGF